MDANEEKHLREEEKQELKKEEESVSNRKGSWKGVVFFFFCFTLSFVLGAFLCYFYFFGFPKRQENQAIHNGTASSSTLSDSNLDVSDTFRLFSKNLLMVDRVSSSKSSGETSVKISLINILQRGIGN